VRREIFLEEFWKCFKRLEDTADEMVGKAAYFRFLTLLGLAFDCSARQGLSIYMTWRWFSCSDYRLAKGLQHHVKLLA